MIDSEYYDQLYRGMIDNPDAEGWKWIEERADKVIPLIVGESVLDLGCGLSVISNRIEIAYRGIDGSGVALEWNAARIRNSRASFAMGDIMQHKGIRFFSTVLLLDVLEHVQEPAYLLRLALQTAQERVIVTVPRDMPGKKHYHPRWTGRELDTLMHGATKIESFGGEEDDRWLLAYKDRIEGLERLACLVL